jgi:hypothetical protein
MIGECRYETQRDEQRKGNLVNLQTECTAQEYLRV